MPECEYMDTCTFFNDRMPRMPASAELFKLQYCRSDKASCARYMILSELGRQRVPKDMYPNEIERAKRILARHRSLLTP